MAREQSRNEVVAKPDLDRLLGSKYNSLSESRHLAARLRQRVTPEVASIALEALLRRDRLDPAARLAVFADLAAYLHELVPYPAPSLISALNLSLTRSDLSASLSWPYALGADLTGIPERWLPAIIRLMARGGLILLSPISR